jgi:hypothetical protein
MSATWAVANGDQFITYGGNTVAMADTPNRAQHIVDALNAQETGWSLADERLAAVRAEFERQLAVVDKRLAHAERIGSQQSEYQRMSDALRLSIVTSLAGALTNRATQLGAFSVPTVTIEYRPNNPAHRQWVAQVPVKPYGIPDRYAWAAHTTPQEALTVLLQALTKMVDGTLLVAGGEVTR